MIINPHNVRIIFISQFSSLYTIPSAVYRSLWRYLCGLLQYDNRIIFFQWRTPHHPPPPKRVTLGCHQCTSLHNIPTHATASSWSAFAFYVKQFSLWMNACLSVQCCLYACEWGVGGWGCVSERNHIYKPIIKSLLICLCSEEIYVGVCVFPLRSALISFHLGVCVCVWALRL